ncbi:MAG: tRNA (adenosine(37)-N6)-threonylcarbamoyltransferase complex dimerization subunit type 1 TsaB [Pseudomonadota bacterium]
MTVTICIETSSAHCSVALRRGGQDYADHRHLKRQHNQYLLSMLDDMLAAAECRRDEIDVIGFGCGPGSFTGVRIAAAVAQALAFVADARVLPVPSARVWFESAQRQLPAGSLSANCLVAVASRGQAYYLSHLLVSGQAVTTVREAALYEAPPDWLIETADTESWSVIGQVPEWLPESLQNIAHETVEPAADTVLDFVQGQHNTGMSLAPEYALPSYVQGDSPWKKQSTVS